MTKDAPVVCLLRHRREARFFVDAVTKSEQPDRIRVVNTVPAEGKFVYSVRYSPPGPNKPDAFDYLNFLSGDMRRAMDEGRIRLLIDSSNERHNPSPGQLTLLHAKLAELGFEPAQVTLLTQNTAFPADYKSWCAGNGLAAGIHVANHHFFLRELANFVTTTMIPSGEYALRREKVDALVRSGAPRPRNYLCLNFTPRAHRVITMLYLLKHGLLDKGFVSFSGLKGRKYDITQKIDQLLDRSPFPDVPEMRSLLPKLIDLGALTLDDLEATPVIDIGQAWYYLDSYVSLVTESGIRPAGDNCSFTEKPFKAVLGLHPFIIMGIPNNLREFRRYGFQTFSPAIDESYDGERNDTERVRMLLGEFQRLALMGKGELGDLYASLMPQITHNFEYFAGDLQAMFRATYEADILGHLSGQLQ